MIAELINRVADPERMVAQFATFALVGCGLWMFLRWFVNVPCRPDPWDDDTNAEMEKADSSALCHRCLEPHNDRVNFCPNCGAPVGQYTNILPFIYEFSIGHTLRIGTGGDFKHSPLTVAGFIVLGLVQYGPFAPVYWWKLFHPPLSSPPSEPGPSEPVMKA